MGRGRHRFVHAGGHVRRLLGCGLLLGRALLALALAFLHAGALLRHGGSRRLNRSPHQVLHHAAFGLFLAERHGLVAGAAGLECVAHLGGHAVHQFERSVRRSVHGIDGARHGLGDLSHVFEYLVHAHDFQVGRVHGQRHALDQRIHLRDGRFKRRRDALHVSERRLDLLLQVVHRLARLAHGRHQLDDQPHERGTHHHVHGRQGYVENFIEIHDAPPVVSKTSLYHDHLDSIQGHQRFHPAFTGVADRLPLARRGLFFAF